MLAAIANKEAEVAPSQEQPQRQLRIAQPNKVGKARTADSKLNSHPKAKIRPDLRGEISGVDGKNPKLFCLACKDWKLYATFGRHCTTYHKENDSQDVDEIEVAENAEKDHSLRKQRNQREPR